MRIQTKLKLLALAYPLMVSLSTSPSPAAPIDPTLLRIAADEPIQVPGFPPLPAQADLSGPFSTWNTSAPSGNNSAAMGRKNPAGIIELPPGFFGRRQDQSIYRSINKSDTSEPSLDPKRDQGISHPLPAPIILAQPHIQDLSLPDDQFTISGNRVKAPGADFRNRTNTLLNRMFGSSVTQAPSASFGILNRVIHF